jgi:hypothetical protein
MHVSVKGSTSTPNRTVPLRTRRAEGRGKGRLHFSYVGRRLLSVLVSVRVWYENPQDSDTNHSVVIQFTLNPALWSAIDP